MSDLTDWGNRPSVYKDEDGRVWYRASSLGYCPRALVALRMGYEATPTPDVVQGWYDAGHDAEDVVVEKLRGEGVDISGQQHMVTLEITGKITVTGGIDGLSDSRIMEIKSQSKGAWNDFDRNGWESGLWPKYKWQVSVYMHALSLPLTIVRYNRDTGQHVLHDVDEPFYSLAEISARIMSIETAARRGELPTTCEPMYPCPVFYLHDGQAEEGVEVVEDREFKSAAERLGHLREVEKRVKADLAEVQEVLRTRGLGKKRAGDWEVNVYEQKNPARLDLEKVKEAGIDLSPFYEQTVGQRIRVKRVDGEG